MRLLAPVPIQYGEAIAVATLGLFVNVASVLMLGGGAHDHGHDQGPGHRHDDDGRGRDRACGDAGHHHDHRHHMHRDNNLRAAVVHVMADAAVSILVIIGLLLGRFLGWAWMDPVVGLVGAIVIAAWSYALIRDTGAVLLDMTPDADMAENIRMAVERDGDRLCDLHLWRLGPGHVGAIVSVSTTAPRAPAFYRERLTAFRALSHVTIEVHPREFLSSAGAP
jgi:cation diffusion facilitator family transporter